MATFEEVTRETSRFDAIDTNGRCQVVVEHTTFMFRVGFLRKTHHPAVRKRTYRLLTGRPLNVIAADRFETLDGRIRLERVK